MFLASIIPLSGAQLAVVPHRKNQTGVTSPATTAKATPPATTTEERLPASIKGGKINNAVEYVVTGLDTLINYARKVKGFLMQGIVKTLTQHFP